MALWRCRVVAPTRTQEYIRGMPSRGARPKTPRSAIPTSYYGSGRPQPPTVVRRPARTVIPESNYRIAIGSVITIEWPSRRRRYLFGEMDVELRDGAESHITPSSSLGCRLNGKPVGGSIYRPDGTGAFSSRSRAAPRRRPTSSTRPHSPGGRVRRRAGHRSMRSTLSSSGGARLEGPREKQSGAPRTSSPACPYGDVSFGESAPRRIFRTGSGVSPI